MNQANARVMHRYFPPADAITREQYHRLADLPGTAAPDPRHPCAACGKPFRPQRRTERFCSTPCRRWWHYGAGAKERKAALVSC